MNEKLHPRPFFVLVFVSFLLAVVFASNKYLIKKDYLLYAQVSCDRNDAGACFFNPDEDHQYKLIYYSAGATPPCNLEQGGCPELFCPHDSPRCQTVFCTEETRIRLDLADQCLE